MALVSEDEDELLLHKPVLKCKAKTDSHQVNFRWDKGDIFQYFNLTRDMLNTVHFPLSLLQDDVGDGWSRSDILTCVKTVYKTLCLPCIMLPVFLSPGSLNFYKYWWDEELSLLKESNGVIQVVVCAW